MWWDGRDRSGLDAALDLYRASFDRTALPDERVRGLLETGTYRLAIDGARAMALVARCPGFAHLDYLATAAHERRRGLATRLVKFVVDEARAEGLSAVTVETDDHLVPWYGARGARLLEAFPYLFPSPSQGPLPMNVLLWPLDGADELTRGRASEIVRALYRVIHGRTDPDPILESVLARIPERVVLARLAPAWSGARNERA